MQITFKKSSENLINIKTIFLQAARRDKDVVQMDPGGAEKAVATSEK